VKSREKKHRELMVGGLKGILEFGGIRRN